MRMFHHSYNLSPTVKNGTKRPKDQKTMGYLAILPKNQKGGRTLQNNSTIFGRETKPIKPKNFTSKNHSPKPRKKRSDAKRDIKFRLSPEDRKTLKLHAMDHRLSLTAFSSMVVKQDLIREKEYKNFDYDNDGHFVHVRLESDYFEMVKTLSIEWDLPYRKVVHRMIMDYIWRANGGISISSWNE